MSHETYEVEGRAVLGFNSGLDSRSFAQAKLARFITEPGLIVSDDHVELWRASGVVEVTNAQNVSMMAIWGPLFEGERLDLLLNEAGQQDRALEAVIRWIQAVLALEHNTQFPPPFWPCAAIIGETGILFAPPSITLRCIMGADEAIHFSGGEWYVNPGINGMDAAAFTAAAMLYRIFSGMAPFTARDEAILHQDMKMGNFVPVQYAAPGLDSRLTALIQNALKPAEKRTGNAGSIKGITLLSEILAVIGRYGKTVSAASMFQPVSEADRRQLEKGKARFLKRKTASVSTRRFVMRNTAIITASLAALIIVIIAVHSTAKNRALSPSMAGLQPIQVIESYYEAFGSLDHQIMEACVIRGAGKNDINMVINFFVVNKMRQTYEASNPPVLLSARTWQQMGGEPLDPKSFQVFGVTDLDIEYAMDSGDHLSNGKVQLIRYRVNYTLWVPAAVAEESMSETGTIDDSMPVPYQRSDLITLVQYKKGWRISDLKRE